MNRALLLLLVALTLAIAFGAFAQAPVERTADPLRSEFRIELGRSGLLKALGDDHRIEVRNYRCEVFFAENAPQHSSVKLVIPAASLKVVDPDLSAEKRAEVQAKMLGPEVLDAENHGEISFRSRQITHVGGVRYRVEGDLMIRTEIHPAAFDVTLGRDAGTPVVTGEARVKLSTFRIKPPSAGAGTVRVKDEMRIVFRLVLVPPHS